MGGEEGVLFLADPTALPQDTMVTLILCSAATRLTRFPPLCQYKGLFVKAQSTSFFIDIINAPWFVHYSQLFHCYLTFCTAVINNEAVQFLGSSRIKILALRDSMMG